MILKARKRNGHWGKEVRHVAKLAKLAFADNEILHFAEQMSDIIDMVEQLNE